MKRIRVSSVRPLVLVSFSRWISYACQNSDQRPGVKTPNILFAIAGEGILFTRAYTPNAKCAPSRSSILTGLNSWQSGDRLTELRQIGHKILYSKPTTSLWEDGVRGT